jgi:hypothetical protein
VHLYFCLPPYLFAIGLIKNTAFCERFCAKRGKYDAQEGKISCAKEQKTRQSRGHFPPNHRRKKTAPEFDPAAGDLARIPQMTRRFRQRAPRFRYSHQQLIVD